MKTGLIMEGGAMRGLFTAGITDVLMENNITFDGAIGVSAGAAFGCNYKSKQIGRALRYNKTYCRDKRYCSLHSLLTTGDLFGADFCYREIPEVLDLFDNETFYKNPMDFYVVCTDMNTGDAVYKKLERSDHGLMCEWIRASASLPLVSRPVILNGRPLSDGGTADSIPIRFFESLGYDKNVIILTREKGYYKKSSKLMNFMMKLWLIKYPKLAEAIKKRAEMYNETLEYIEQKEAKGEIFVFRPKSPLPIERIEKDPDKLQMAYDIGRALANEKLAELKAFLEQ